MNINYFTLLYNNNDTSHYLFHYLSYHTTRHVMLGVLLFVGEQHGGSESPDRSQLESNFSYSNNNNNNNHNSNNNNNNNSNNNSSPFGDTASTPGMSY